MESVILQHQQLDESNMKHIEQTIREEIQNVIREILSGEKQIGQQNEIGDDIGEQWRNDQDSWCDMIYVNQSIIEKLFNRYGLELVDIFDKDSDHELYMEFESLALGGEMPERISDHIDSIINNLSEKTETNLKWAFSFNSPFVIRIMD